MDIGGQGYGNFKFSFGTPHVYFGNNDRHNMDCGNEIVKWMAG